MSTSASLVGRDAEYRFDDLIAAEQWHFWFRARRQLVLWALDRYLPRAGTFLEVGCGAGFVLEGIRRQYPAMQLAACDASPAALAHARSRVARVQLFQADVTQLPVGSKFDGIAALDVIEHVDDDESALAEMFRALQPGGCLVLTVPQHQWLWSQVDDFSCHRRRYDRRGLAAKARAAGFDVVHTTSYFSATLPFAIASRWRLRRDQAFDPSAELRISKLASAFLGALLIPEWYLVRAGGSIPAGSSLLLVARRPPT